MFNPLDELQPDLHTGGQSLPMQPNIQSIITFIKVSFLFHQQQRVYSRSEAKGEFYTGGKKKRLPGFFCKHSTKRGKTLPTSLSLLLALRCQSISQSLHHTVGRHKSSEKAYEAAECRAWEPEVWRGEGAEQLELTPELGEIHSIRKVLLMHI